MTRAVAAIATAIVSVAAPAFGFAVGPSPSLEELAHTADLVCKATVVSERVTIDSWFDAIEGFEVRDTQLRVASIIKGAAPRTIWFRHYARSPTARGAGSFTPQLYSFTIGRSYLVFAAKTTGDVFRQLDKRSTAKPDLGVMLAANDRPHHGATVTAAAWAELQGLLASGKPDDVLAAIVQLDELSGGHQMQMHDFGRPAVLAAIRPMILASSEPVATAAIAVFGEDSPYFDDSLAMFWLAGMGKGTIPGIGPMTPSPHRAAEVAATQLLAAANGHASGKLRGLAIRALGRAPAATVAAWLRDPDPLVRGAALLMGADPKAIAIGATDHTDDLRRIAALAIGFSQDPALVPVLDGLLKDNVPEVREAAALSVLSFAIDQAADVMKANLGSDFRPLFVNALARRDPKPYLAMLAEVIEHQLAPAHWWGGEIPAGDSWTIVFDYVKARSASELTAGKLDRTLDALERMQWFGSSEPVMLYALYVSRGMPARAKKFRDAIRKALTYSVEDEFDQAAKNPSSYVP